MTPPASSSLKVRLGIASILALLALLLTAAEAVTGGADISAPGAGRSAKEAAITAAVDSLYALYGVDVSHIRSWKATAGGGRTGRTEVKIPVEPGFRSLEFNHALATACAPLGAGVVATERSKENSVTMHIVLGGTTVRSLRFVPEAGR
jgi:hypothetical protein